MSRRSSRRRETIRSALTGCTTCARRKSVWGAFLEEYEGLFPDEVKNFFQDVRERVWEAEDEIEED